MKSLVAALSLALCWNAARAGIHVRLQGNDGIGKRKLLEVIDPDPEDYSRDGLRVWREDAEYYLLDLYHANGYFEARIQATLVQRDGKPEDWDARIEIGEGPRYAFGPVTVRAARLGRAEAVEPQPAPDSSADSTAAGVPRNATGITTGNGAGPDQDGAGAVLVGPGVDSSELEARPGKPFRQDALLADRRTLMRRYGDAGFMRVEADDRIDVRAASRTVAVEYLLDPGQPVLFDTLVVRNMRAPPQDSLAGLTLPDIFRDLAPYARGDTVRMSPNDKLVEKLQYTGAFNYVRIKDSLRSGADGRSTLYLYSEEHVPGSLRSSLFYETQYGPGFSMDGRHGNLAGTLNEARAGLFLANKRQTVYMGYGSPLTLGALIRFDEDMDFNWYQDDPKVHAGKGPFEGDFRWTNSARLTWPLRYWLRLVSDAQLEAKSRLVGAEARERDLSLNFLQTAFLNFVDREMDPTRGLRFAFTWGNGGPLQKNNVFRFAEYRHNWFEARTSQYYPVPGLRMLKLATRLDGGRFFGQGGANSERFFLGGSRSVRSYDFQNLCPMGPADTVCVAQDSSLAYVQAGAEVRAEPFWFLNPRGHLHWFSPLQIVPFLDFGKVWDVRHPVRFTWTGKPPSGEGYALGLGLRYPLLGIFNLRTDFVLKGSGGKGFWLDLAQAF